MKYKIELIKSEEGFAVSCPELPGCWSQGATEEEAIQNIKSAISEYLVAEYELRAGLSNQTQDKKLFEVKSRRLGELPAGLSYDNIEVLLDSIEGLAHR